MRNATIISMLAALAFAGACREDDVAERRAALIATIHEQRAPYMQAIDQFLDATSRQDFERAYQLLAPSYTNMVTLEQFTASASTNRNFARKLPIDVARTSNVSGTFTIEGTFGDLGRAQISLTNTPAGPRIAGFTIGGMSALPAPGAASQH